MNGENSENFELTSVEKFESKYKINIFWQNWYHIKID